MDTLASAILAYMAHEAHWRAVRAYSAREHALWEARGNALARASRGETPRCSVCGRWVHIGFPCSPYSEVR
jgi:hypothetical protein